MTAKDASIDARDWSLLGLLSVLWGGSFFFNGVVLRELPPFTVVFLRVTLAAIMLLPLLWLYRIRFPKGLSGWRPFIAIGFLNNVLPFSLIVVGQTYIPGVLASAAMMTVVAGLVERPWLLPIPGPSTWLAVIGLAGLSTALAYIVFFQILRRSGATNVMLVTLLIPVTAILLGYLVLGEKISPREIAGALVIGSALLLIDGRVLKFFQR